jgi:hypothetical protein
LKGTDLILADANDSQLLSQLWERELVVCRLRRGEMPRSGGDLRLAATLK